MGRARRHPPPSDGLFPHGTPWFPSETLLDGGGLVPGFHEPATGTATPTVFVVVCLPPGKARLRRRVELTLGGFLELELGAVGLDFDGEGLFLDPVLVAKKLFFVLRQGQDDPVRPV